MTTKTDNQQEQKAVVAPVNLDTFDWNAYENDLGVYNAPKEEIEAKYDQTLSKVQVGEVVEGTVISLNKREVVVNIGYKSEGIIPVSEFRYNPELAVGEKVEVYVESAEDKKGQLVLSHKKARQLRSWDRVNEALEKDEVIKGYIKCRTKGGMIVDVFGIEAFLPGSQIDVKPIRDYDIYVDKTMEFKVVKINQEFRNVVVSHKALIEAELEAQKKEIMSKLEKGQILEGTVKNITSYGVFIDLGGVDGLIHISDLSWTKKVKHPSEFTQIGADIEVVVLEIDKDNRRLSLGHKQLEENPWNAFEQQFAVDSIHTGTITELNDKGAVVSLGDNVEGFAPAKQLAKEDGTTAKAGETLEFKVVEFSKATKRIILSHSRLNEEIKRAEVQAERAEKKRSDDATKDSVKKLNASVEKTTLGDISGLAELKAQMEAAAEKPKKAAAKKSAKAEEASAETEE